MRTRMTVSAVVVVMGIVAVTVLASTTHTGIDWTWTFLRWGAYGAVVLVLLGASAFSRMRARRSRPPMSSGQIWSPQQGMWPGQQPFPQQQFPQQQYPQAQYPQQTYGQQFPGQFPPAQQFPQQPQPPTA